VRLRVSSNVWRVAADIGIPGDFLKSTAAETSLKALGRRSSGLRGFFLRCHSLKWPMASDWRSAVLVNGDRCTALAGMLSGKRWLGQ